MSSGGRESDAASPAGRIIELPLPGALTLVDYQRRELNLCILVIGAAADEALRHVFRATASETAEVVDATSWSEPSFTYLPLRLGDVRGFEIRLHLYGLGADERLLPMLDATLASASGLVVACEDSRPPLPLSGLVRVVAEWIAAVPSRVPVAILAPPTSDHVWRETAGAAPAFVREMSEDACMLALKEITKECLVRLRRDAPPGAPEAGAAPSPERRTPWWKFW